MTTHATVGELASQVRGVTFAKDDASLQPGPGLVPVIRAGNIQDGRLIFDDLVYVPEGRVSEKQRLRKNDVVVATSSGSIDVVGKAGRCIADFPGGFGAFLKVLRPGPHVDAAYFAHYFQTPSYRQRVSRLAAGANINNLRNEHLDDLDLRLPPIHEQRRIATILDQADALRARRRQVLAHLDALTQSIFHEMFGSLQDRSWRSAPLHSVVPVIENGTSRRCETRRARDSEWGILKLGAVTTGAFRAQENKAYLSDVSDLTVNEVKSGDVLMTRKNTRELVGAVVVVDAVRPRLLLPDLIFRLKLHSKQINSQYFQALMMNPMKRQEVQALAGGSAGSMPNISKARLGKLPIELPPMPLQEQFSAKVRNAAAHREIVEGQVAALDRLFESLQSRAFGGEL